ncbi:hypothetical protein ES703_104784 [subsurface metagenome]
MELKKEILIEILKKIGNKCESCGGYYIGAAITASTEDGNYGIVFDEIIEYPISCNKCPECAIECYNNLSDYIDIHGHAPCDDSGEALEDTTGYLEDAEENECVECYRYTYDYQDKILQYGSGHITAGCLIDLSEVVLKKIGNIGNIEIENLDF